MKKLISLIFGFLILASIYAQSSLSPEEYALKFFKKFNETQKKLTYMNKPGTLEKMGTETVKGNISGTVFYDVKIKGMGAVVTLRYTNYCDEEGWVYDGEIITHANMSQNGTFSGIIKVTGVSPSEVCYDNVIMKKGQPQGGYYLLTQPDLPPVKIDYTLYLKSKD